MPPHPTGETDDLVVLVDDDGAPCGTASRSRVHTDATPRHLAFSCHLLAPDGRLLVTRRALSKRTWPGVWTNAFCGHPRPGEELLDAVARRGAQELGVRIDQPRVVLPEFSYRATDDSGVVENELCPVVVARLASPVDDLVPDPDEVVAWRLVEVAALATLATTAPWALSPWAAQQLADPALVESLTGGPA